jgi:hypothetical protein
VDPELTAGEIVGKCEATIIPPEEIETDEED